VSSESYVPSLFHSPSSSPKLINGDLYRLWAVFYRLWTRDDPLCSLGSCIHYCFKYCNFTFRVFELVNLWFPKIKVIWTFKRDWSTPYSFAREWTSSKKKHRSNLILQKLVFSLFFLALQDWRTHPSTHQSCKTGNGLRSAVVHASMHRSGSYFYSPTTAAHDLQQTRDTIANRMRTTLSCGNPGIIVVVIRLSLLRRPRREKDAHST
jgi:hypothetical protein